MILIGSVLLGWHYAADGVAAIAIALIAWQAAVLPELFRGSLRQFGTLHWVWIWSISTSKSVRVLILPSALCVLMIVLAIVAADVSSLDVRPLFVPYMSSALAISLLATMAFIFVEFANLARTRADDPIAKVRAGSSHRAPLIALPAMVLPLFLISYTAAKCSIQFVVGYGWDEFFANADKFIFGDDVWDFTRGISRGFPQPGLGVVLHRGVGRSVLHRR